MVTDILTEMGMGQMVMELLLMATVVTGMVMAVGMGLMGNKSK
jgi:hypothetical protein